MYGLQSEVERLKLCAWNNYFDYQAGFMSSNFGALSSGHRKACSNSTEKVRLLIRESVGDWQKLDNLKC